MSLPGSAVSCVSEIPKAFIAKRVVVQCLLMDKLWNINTYTMVQTCFFPLSSLRF